MNACTLNMLHNTRNEYILSVADTVNFQFLAHNVFVNKYRLFCIYINSGLKIVAKRLLIRYNLHCTTAQHERRTNKNRISDFFGNCNALLDIGYSLALWLRNAEVCHYLFKAVTIFRTVDCFDIRTDNRNSECIKRCGKVNRSLTAERNNDTKRLFKLDNVHNILNCKRLEIKLVRGCIVG